jgi:hypothetical protein
VANQRPAQHTGDVRGLPALIHRAQDTGARTLAVK